MAFMKKMVSFVRIVDKMNMWIAKVMGFLVIPTGGLLLYGVILRYIFNRPVGWEGEIAWLFFIGFALLAGAYALRLDRHVRLDVVYSRFSLRRKAIADMATFIFFLLFIGLLTWLTIGKAVWSVSIVERSAYTTSHTPIYPARVCLALGCVLLLLQGVAEFIGWAMFVTGHKIEGRVE
jgi:TRAP-type mannitol/chloroaromatic compound transport system permease small subunit